MTNTGLAAVFWTPFLFAGCLSVPFRSVGAVVRIVNKGLSPMEPAHLNGLVN